ncbi:hypothetical protein M0G43_13655 [Subsaxibacter sp. CAU 1640]|uniref:hypothetical protein n=1 Tax=Subsaxibacter sp. CAU 1640 TaxID=2933271 RepID=UPI0020032A36|nr:hypothetical protein [Subsaxibacter sp. CAU 1640]MCK7591628.1 hypothetical protein [Subsaxibacter sp. CAU 1640]
MKKKTLIGILIIALLTIIGFFVLMTNFEIFDQPFETELKAECDFQKTRKIKLTERDGNAVTNRSLHIYATYCNNIDDTISEPIFVVDAPFVNRNDVSFKWKSFDTLTIKYDKRLKVIEQKTESELINPRIVIKYTSK